MIYFFIFLGVVLIGILSLVFALIPPRFPKPEYDSFILKNIHIINPPFDTQRNVDILVRNGIIERIGYSIDNTDEGVKIVTDFENHYIVPGLIDLHLHLPPHNTLQLTGYFNLLFLYFGITTVRDTGDVDGTAVPYARKSLETGKFPGPRVFACGPYVIGGKPRWSNSVVVENPQQAEEAVIKIKNEGYNFIKCYDELTNESIQAIKKAAEKHNIPVIGHIPTAVKYEEALIQEVQHFLGVPDPLDVQRDHLFNRLSDWRKVDDERMGFLVKLCLEYNIGNTPTLVLSRNVMKFENYPEVLKEYAVQLMPKMYREVIWSPEIGLGQYKNISNESFRTAEKAFEKKKMLLKKLYEAGATLYLGTDTSQPFTVPGAALWGEMNIFQESGIPPAQVWKLATVEAGKRLKLANLGTIIEKAPADFLIFKENPLEQTDALSFLRATTCAGKLFLREKLEKVVLCYQKFHRGKIFETISILATKRVLKKVVQRDY
jgi:Amidohydrolase family